MATSVFLSYARAARPLVDGLAADLRRAGVEPFFDEQLTSGQQWWDELLNRIERCDAFIPVLSREYITSNPCRSEAEYAHSLSKPLLPVMVETVNPAELLNFIVETHATSYDHNDGKTILDLVRAINECPTHRPLPTPMPPRPEIPVSYLDKGIQSAKARVESSGDMSRSEQLILLDDLKTMLISQQFTALQLLKQFNRRSDIIASVTNEIDRLLHESRYSDPVSPPVPDSRATGGTPDDPPTQGRGKPLNEDPPWWSLPPIGVHGFPLLADDLQWSGPVAGAVSTDHVLAGQSAWVNIGDPLLTVRSHQGLVTLSSPYIGFVQAVHVSDGQALHRDRPLFSMAVSGWLYRANARSPFATGVILVTGSPSRRVDPSGTSSHLFVSVDGGSRRAVPWSATCLLAVPPGDHVISAIYVQPGANSNPAGQAVRIRGGNRVTLMYEAPRTLTRPGRLRR